MDDQSEQMIKVYAEWLNKHHEANKDNWTVRRGDFDEHDDPPRILATKTYLPNTIYERTIVTLYTHPYHDDGGPTILTGFFNTEGELWTMLQYFDTDDYVIFFNGAFNPTSLPNAQPPYDQDQEG